MFKFPSFLRGGTVPALSPQQSATPMTIEQRQALFQACSLLLSYPGDTFDMAVELIAASLNDFPADISADLDEFCSWAIATGRRGVEQAYVDTFDTKRRCCLELSYFATGDTRQRGIALTIFRDLYRAVGFELDNSDLPDFLPNVLELSARCTSQADVAVVDSVIASHREGIEIMHAALSALSSPWAHVVSALRRGLPEVDEETSHRLQKLVRQGPPQELVGVSSLEQLPWPTAGDPAGLPADMSTMAGDSSAPGAVSAPVGYQLAVAATARSVLPRHHGAVPRRGNGALTPTVSAASARSARKG